MTPEFKRLFFRYYDKKIASGEISFLRAGFNKAEFIAMCSGEDFDVDEAKVLDYCEKLRLSDEESAELLVAAGFGCENIEHPKKIDSERNGAQRPRRDC